MPSSTSHFNPRWPGLTVRLILVGLVTWGLAAYYTLRWNPEIRHFVRTDDIKHAWATRLDQDYTNKVVVFGGSSCEFSLDGERLLNRFALPCVNLGRGAGMGAVVLTMAALEETRPGDTLIMAMEPGLLTESLNIPYLGAQFAAAAGHLAWVRHPLPPADPLPWANLALALRPGGYHTFTMLGKMARGQELYRYKAEDMRPSGFNQTAVRIPISGPPGHGAEIPSDTRDFLRSLRKWSDEHQVRLAYSLPWAYTPTNRFADFQLKNIRFLRQVAEIMPVLRDPRLGAYSVREQFADTAWHLDETGAALRTDSFGTQLQAWQIWSREELQREWSARTQDHNSDATPLPE